MYTFKDLPLRQQQIIELLEDGGAAMTASEIALELDTQLHRTQCDLSFLINSNYITHGGFGEYQACPKT